MCKCGCAVYNCTLITRLTKWLKQRSHRKGSFHIIFLYNFYYNELAACSSQTRVTNNRTIKSIQLEPKNSMVHAIQLIHKWNTHFDILMENSEFIMHVWHPQSEAMPAIECIFHFLNKFIVRRSTAEINFSSILSCIFRFLSNVAGRGAFYRFLFRKIVCARKQSMCRRCCGHCIQFEMHYSHTEQETQKRTTNCCWRSLFIYCSCFLCSSFFELFLFKNRMLQWSRNDATCSLCIRTVVIICNENHIANITGEVERWARSTWCSFSSFFFFDKLLHRMFVHEFVYLFDLIICPLDLFLFFLFIYSSGKKS